MYELRIGSMTNPQFTFTDKDLLSVNRVNTLDMTSSKLEVDQFTSIIFYVNHNCQTWCPKFYDIMLDNEDVLFASNKTFSSSISSIVYSTPVWFFKDDALVGKYYVKKITRSKRSEYKLECESAIGMLVDQYHYGGLYEGTTFETIVTDIIGGQFAFSCEDDVKNTAVYGHLPYDTRRNNLHALMFATGVYLTKDANGDLRFSYLYGNAPQTIPQDRIYINGNVDYGASATEVHLTEHGFAQTSDDTEIALFNNLSEESATADNTLVVFTQSPIYGFKVNTTPVTTVPGQYDDLYIHALGVNYAILSGEGTLYGKPYSDITRVVKKSLLSSGDQKIIESDECRLVSGLNSDYIAERLLVYYSSRKTVKADVVLDEEATGLNVQFADYFGETETGYIRKMEINSGAIEKASCEIITDYTPTGQGNEYTSFALLSGSGTWEIPDEVFEKEEPTIKVIMIGGGDGGQSGGDGENGEVGKLLSDTSTGGKGGKGGRAGAGGKIYVTSIDCTGLTELTYSCGIGGIGAASTGTTPVDGTQGTATTLTAGTTVYTSASGEAQSNGYKNLFTGIVYGRKGKQDSVDGGNGSDSNTSSNGDSVVYNGRTYNGGSHGTSLTGLLEKVQGGGGGGAAVGQINLLINGGNAVSVTIDQVDVWVAGSGGHGSSPVPTKRNNATVFGQGGLPGHGAGGGGAGGCGVGIGHIHTVGLGGAKGNGGTGGDGANGCIIIYI